MRATGTLVNDAYFLENSKNMDALKAYMADIAVMFGADSDAAQKEMEDCLDFEIKLYKVLIQMTFLSKKIFISGQ